MPAMLRGCHCSYRSSVSRHERLTEQIKLFVPNAIGWSEVNEAFFIRIILLYINNSIISSGQ